MTHAEMAAKLAAHIRKSVRPLLGAPGSRTVTGTAKSGDATFSIDDVAERAVEEFVRQHDLQVGLYTEDAGLRTYGEPETLLVIDPLDGTRGAMAGFECCVVSVAVAQYKPDPRLSDVIAGCIHEIMWDRVFIAERGGGARIVESDAERPVRLSPTTEIESAAWSGEFVGRPTELVAYVLGEVIDASSVKGGFFVMNSSAYSLTRLLTGQLAAVVDPAARVIEDVPNTREDFLRVGNGAILGLFPHDLAAAVLIADEAGCTITDAWGRSLANGSLLKPPAVGIYSLLAAANRDLHRQFLEAIDRGIARLRTGC